MRIKTLLLILLGALFSSFPSVYGQSSRSDDLRQEEVENYFAKWLDEDVRYIISDEEKAIFQSLSTIEEKEQFIEQFWFRRDTDPRTSENEFKEEHYRRIAYANEKFTSGERGWLTDRGRIYIIHGPPDNIVARPDGGAYKRPLEEGGGTTAVYPYEKWFYQYIEGIGPGVEMEFVDATNTGDYKLAVFDWEKDALLRSGDGATLAEETRMTTRADHPALTPAAGGAGYGPQNMDRRANDTPFARYELVAKLGAAPITKYPDLKELVEVNLSYETLNFDTQEEFFRLNEKQVLVPITIQVRNKDLSFEQTGDFQVAKMAVYGMVTSLSNRIITEFEDDVTTSYTNSEVQSGLTKSSVYQKVLTVDNNTRYKLDLVVKDLNSGKVGAIRKAIVPPAFPEQDLVGSSMILSDRIETLGRVPDQEEMFVIGDVKILPRINGEFTNQMPLGVYYQVYNAALDQSTMEPSLQVTFSLMSNGTVLAEAVDEAKDITQFFSGRRVVLMKKLSLDGLEPGDYQIKVSVKDLIKDQVVESTGNFSVVEES